MLPDLVLHVVLACVVDACCSLEGREFGFFFFFGRGRGGVGGVVPGECGVDDQVGYGAPFGLEVVIGGSVAAAEEEEGWAHHLLLVLDKTTTVLKQSAERSNARSRRDADERSRVEGQVVHGKGTAGRLDADLDGGADGQVAEVARAETLAGFADDGAVVDKGGEDFELVDVVSALFVGVGDDLVLLDCGIASVAEAEFAGADDGELEESGVGDLDAGEILKDLQDGSARARGVIVELVTVTSLCELLETFLLERVGGVVGHELEECPFGDGGDVEVVRQDVANCCSLWEMIVSWPSVLCPVNLNPLLGNLTPSHQVDKLLYILGVVLGVN